MSQKTYFINAGKGRIKCLNNIKYLKYISAIVLVFLEINSSLAQTAYIANNANGAVKVINTLTDTLVTTIQLQFGLYGVAASPDGNRVYITNNLSNSVSIINTATNAVIAALPTATGPKDIIVSPDNSKSYFIVGAYLYVIDASTNTITNNYHLGNDYNGLAISPDGTKIYASCNITSSTFSIKIFSTISNSVTNTIAVTDKPYELRVSPDGSKVYIANTDYNTIQVMDTLSNSIINTITVGSHPVNMCFNSNGSKLYVTNNVDGTVSVVNTNTYSVTTTINNIGDFPTGISITPNDAKVYVTNNHRNTAVDINSLNNTPVAIIQLSTGVYTDPLCYGNFISAFTQPTGIETYNNGAINISIFPNPTTGQFTIELPTDKAEIYITDLHGQQIINTPISEKTIKLQINNNGIYIIHIKTKYGISIRKLVVNH